VLINSGLWRAGAACVLLFATQVAAQDSSRAAPRDTAAPQPSAGARQPRPAPTLDFSGVIFANYQYGGPKGNRTLNRFELDRAYLNFRVNPADRFAIRVTADVFQQRDPTRDAYYRGWTFRAKYAYAQYEYLRASNGVAANARLGLINTVIIDTEEQVWPRGIAPVAVDQFGFMSSSDAGLSTTATLPNGNGEVHASIVNGSGYQSREVDRFKDYAARVTYTPLAGRESYFRTLSISPWYSQGSRASDYARRRGTVQAVDDARNKSRTGLLITVRDPRLTVGAHGAWQFEEDEVADTTTAVAPTVTDRTGRIFSTYAILRPLLFGSSRTTSPFSLIARFDDYRPNVDVAEGSRFTVVGVTYEFNRRISLTLDHQGNYPWGGATGVDTKVWFAHVIANF
jgi:hypothetical protein